MPRPGVLGRRDTLRLAAAGSLAPFVGCERRVGARRQHAALWFTYGGKNREVLEQLVRRFNVSQGEFTLDAVFQGDYFEGLAKLRTAIAAGAAPALSHVVGEVVPYLQRAGVLEPFDRFEGAAALDFVPELGQAKSWVNGQDHPLVALPFNRSTPIAYLNGELFAAAGRSAPQTWDELRDTAKLLTVRRATHTVQYGFGCPISWWFWVALVGQAGGRIISPRGKPELGGAAGDEALELWQKLVHVDRSMKRPPGRDYNAWEQTNQDFLAGRAAMIWTSTAFLRYLEDNAPFPVVAAPLPRYRRRAVPTGGTHWIMPRGSTEGEQQAAWAFLKFVNEPEQIIEWATSTGYMPVTAGAIARLRREGYYAKHPNDAVTIDQLAVAIPWPWSTGLFRIQREIVQPRLEQAVLSNANAKSVLDEGRQLANAEDSQ